MAKDYEEKESAAGSAAGERPLTLDFQGQQTIEVQLQEGDEQIIESIVQVEVTEEGVLTLYRRIGGTLRQWAGYNTGQWAWYRTVSS